MAKIKDKIKNINRKSWWFRILPFVIGFLIVEIVWLLWKN